MSRQLEDLQVHHMCVGLAAIPSQSVYLVAVQCIGCLRAVADHFEENWIQILGCQPYDIAGMEKMSMCSQVYVAEDIQDWEVALGAGWEEEAEAESLRLQTA